MTLPDITLPIRKQIEKRAYELYLARGCGPGKEVEDWLAAERELNLESGLTKAIRRPQKKKASPIKGSEWGGVSYDGRK